MKCGTKLTFNTENDEVVKFKTYHYNISEHYKYIHKNIFYKMWSFITYRLIATPLAFVYYKIINPVKFVNKKVLKQCKNNGYFIYANHTNQFGDAFCPALICFPKKPYVIVNPDNIAMPFLGRCLKMWGAIPTPNTINASKNFNIAIKHHLKHNNPILIYPEAHLWPYYTKIRNFPSTSFRYPVKLNKPVYCFTTIYKRKKFSKKPRTEIYIDGPFFIDTSIPEKEAQHKLRNEIYTQMKQRSLLSNYNYVSYIKRSEND